jgi:hypothetical protein
MFKNIGLTFFLTLGLVLMVFLNLKQCNDKKSMKAANDLYAYNLKALNDTVRTERNKSEQLEYTKTSLIAGNGSLKELNKSLDSEAKKQKGKVIYIQASNGVIWNTTPSTITGNVTFSDTTFTVAGLMDVYYDSSNYRSFKVMSTLKIDSARKITLLKTELVKDSLGFNIITGLQEEGKSLRIFIRSDYPGLVFTKIDGALIDPKKSDVIKSFFPNKKWSMGPQVGIGINSQMKTCLYIGFGIQYNLINLK